MNLYDFTVMKPDGSEQKLSAYKGKVVLLVNTATGCGFTPQYGELQTLYEMHQKDGLEILGFPSDQFNHQTPEDDEGISHFCSLHFGVSFTQFAKTTVAGENAIPLYKWISENTKFYGFGISPKSISLSASAYKMDHNFRKNGDIKWNFTKILIDTNGNIVDRFEPTMPMAIVRMRVEELLYDRQENCIFLTGDNVRANVYEYAKKVRDNAYDMGAGFFSHTEQHLKKHNRKMILVMAVPVFVLFMFVALMVQHDVGVRLTFSVVLKTLLKLFPVICVLQGILYFSLRKSRIQISKLSVALEHATAGDLDYRLDWNVKGPLSQAYADYNQMCQQMKISQKQMCDAIEEANRANEAKSAFLSNMSHEIRTPINAVLGLDEMIVRESREANIRAYARDIQSSGKSLLALINDILDFSKIESGKLEIIPVEYDLSSVINDLMNMSADKAKTKGLAFNVHVNEQIPNVLFGDEIRIKQIALNVLSNAVKYTDNGAVDFYIDYEPIDAEHISLIMRIRDTGKGIKPEDLDKLFAPFQRIEEKRNRTIEGTGLGMSITKQLLAMMDSYLEVTSEYGKGSEFSFRIVQERRSDRPIGNFQEAYERLQREERVYTESFHAPDAHVLVVDDVELNLTVFTSLLKQTQIQIDTATSGRAALELADQKQYHLIFVDHMMPDMDGIETLHNLEHSICNAETPVFVLTANAVSGSREKYIAEGFKDYLTKPIDSKKLENAIRENLPEELVHTDIQVRNRAADLPEEELKPDLQYPDLSESEIASLQKLEAVGTIQVQDGIGAVGDAATYLKIVVDFAGTAETRQNMIEQYAEQSDWHNFTVQVHALKSSARLVGQMVLSEKAKKLEELGNACAEGQIRELLPDLMSDYRELEVAIKDIFAQNEDKEIVPAELLQEAISGLREAVEVFDFDTADLIMSSLEEWSMPTEFAETYRKLKVLMAEVDRDAIIKILG